MTPGRGATAAYPLLLALGALDATGYSVIVPVAPAIADATGAGPATIGLLVASFPAGMVGGFALAGWLVRRLGARALLCGSLALVALGALGFVLGDSLAVYFPSRLVMGVGSGGIWIGVTFDTLERWPGQEYLCMSRVFAAYSVGGLIGPALGALDATGYSVIVPVAPAIADATGAGPATVGLLVASFPAGMVVGFALAGWLVRRFGARALLCGSLALVALGALGFVLGDSLAVYFPARLLMGLGSGGIWSASRSTRSSAGRARSTSA